jgi:cytosine/uracil/thiamine/allantoin permease
MRPLYDYAWFVGFAVAALVYLALSRPARLASHGEAIEGPSKLSKTN